MLNPPKEFVCALEGGRFLKGEIVPRFGFDLSKGGPLNTEARSSARTNSQSQLKAALRISYPSVNGGSHSNEQGIQIPHYSGES
jgi:hypothetical protein